MEYCEAAVSEANGSNGGQAVTASQWVNVMQVRSLSVGGWCYKCRQRSLAALAAGNATGPQGRSLIMMRSPYAITERIQTRAAGRSPQLRGLSATAQSIRWRRAIVPVGVSVDTQNNDHRLAHTKQLVFNL